MVMSQVSQLGFDAVAGILQKTFGQQQVLNDRRKDRQVQFQDEEPYDYDQSLEEEWGETQVQYSNGLEAFNSKAGASSFKLT